MDPHEIINEILDRYEVHLERGETLSAEELCREHPELISTVATRIAKLQLYNHLAGCDSAKSAEQQPTQIGRYRVVQYLGGGGQGNVYLCRRDDPPGNVAVKVLGPSFRTGIARERFEREKRLLSELAHPGIAKIFDAGIDDVGFGPTPFLVMEYIAGRRLTDFAEEQRLSSAERLSLLVKVCHAVDYANAKGVVHRDLKPANILVDALGQPKVIDFGVAKVDNAEQKLTDSAAGQPGTQTYMSPEQVSPSRFGDTGAQADVYSLGVIGYQLLTGRLPYDVDHHESWALQHAIVNEEATALRKHNRKLSSDLNSIFAKALEKTPSRRYQTASELAADIVRYQEQKPVQARKATYFYQTNRLIQRNPALFGGIAAAFVSLILGLLGTAYGLQRARSSEATMRIAAADLAFERGDWKSGLPYLTPIQNAPTPETWPLYLRAARAATNQLDFATAEKLLGVARPPAEHPQRALWELSQADLLLSRDANLTEADMLVKSAIDRQTLDDADLWYAKGLVARDTLEALNCFSQAVEVADSRHFRAQLGLLYCRFFLGRHDEVVAQAAAIQQLFPAEESVAGLGALSNALQQPDALGTYAAQQLLETSTDSQSYSILPILDASAMSAMYSAGARQDARALFTDLLSALGSFPADSLLSAIASKATGDRAEGAERVAFATRHVPVIARAWRDVEEAIRAYEQSGSTREIVATLETATRSHPEASIYFMQGGVIMELAAANTDELLEKVIQGENAFHLASQSNSMIPLVQADARELAIMGEYILGRPTRRVGPPDPLMRQRALDNMIWLVRNNRLREQKAALHVGYALELQDPAVARETAIQWEKLRPDTVEPLLGRARAELEAGSFQAALEMVHRALYIQSDHAEALKLQDDVKRRAREFLESLPQPAQVEAPSASD